MDTRALLIGVGIGAGFAFILDPAGGGRRRALVRDKFVRASTVTRRAADATARDMANRARGIAAVTRGRIWDDEIDEWRLIERVRARLGRACSHPHAIDVEADDDGNVTLRGPILAHEVDGLLATTAAVRGVASVINELDPHESAEGIPSLQGEGRVGGPNIDLLQPNWAPATRAIVGMTAIAAAGAAMAYARR